MIIKSYVASTVADALKMIRAELGGKAVVLKTKILTAKESGRGQRMVEITACLENPTVGQLNVHTPITPAQVAGSDSEPRIERVFEPPVIRSRQAISSASQPSQHEAAVRSMGREESHRQSSGAISNSPDNNAQIRNLEEKLDLILAAQTQRETPRASKILPDGVASIYDAMVASDIPERLCEPLMTRLSHRLAQNRAADVRDVAESMMVEEFAQHSSPTFSIAPGQTALFIGPAGSGKTTVLGKLAVELLFKQKKKVTLATLDDFKVAAHEEIAGYAEALGATIMDAQNAKSISKHTNKTTDSILLVDCHSNITDQRQFNALLERSRALQPDVVVLVLSALTRSDDLIRLVRRFDVFRPTHLVVTHTDLSSSVGGVYTAMRSTSAKLVGVTNAAGSVSRVQAPDPAAMARQLLTHEVAHAD